MSKVAVLFIAAFCLVQVGERYVLEWLKLEAFVFCRFRWAHALKSVTLWMHRCKLPPNNLSSSPWKLDSKTHSPRNVSMWVFRALQSRACLIKKFTIPESKRLDQLWCVTGLQLHQRRVHQGKGRRDQSIEEGRCTFNHSPSASRGSCLITSDYANSHQVTHSPIVNWPFWHFLYIMRIKS